MFSVRSLFSDLCWDRQCSMNSVLSGVRAAKFRTAVDQILRTSELSFPRQVVYQGSGQLQNFFQRQSARLWFLCLHLLPEHGQPVVQYCKSDGKISIFSSPVRDGQCRFGSENAAEDQSRNVQHQVFSSYVHWDSEIVLRMVAKNTPADLPIFYGTRVMEIAALTNPDDWFSSTCNND